MTVKLNNNFLANARGITLADSGSVTWTINLSTNVISAAASGATPSSGLSGTITTAKLTAGGSNGSMTFLNGILTASTAAT